jgi:molybdopterin-guanine dinucleotide biosynthesis protein MobB
MNHIPLIGFVGPSGSGKTTLLRKVIPALRARGIRIAAIKHSHHDIELDTPGKDSFELRKSGATQTILASPLRWTMITETPENRPEASLTELLRQIDKEAIDLVVVEGFKHEHFPKIEVYRATLGKPVLFPEDDDILAVASDSELPAHKGKPRLDLNDPEAIAQYIIDALDLLTS